MTTTTPQAGGALGALFGKLTKAVAPTASDMAAEAITRLDAKRAQSLAVFERARKEYGAASLAADEGAEGAEGALEQARKAVDRAERYFIEADVSLEAAKARHVAALASEAKRTRHAEWDRAEKAGEQRINAATALKAAGEQYARAYRDFMEASAVFRGAVPATHSRPDLVNELLRGGREVDAARFALQQAGIAWAHPHAGGLTAPDATRQIEEETRALVALRPE